MEDTSKYLKYPYYVETLHLDSEDILNEIKRFMKLHDIICCLNNSYNANIWTEDNRVKLILTLINGLIYGMPNEFFNSVCDELFGDKSEKEILKTLKYYTQYMYDLIIKEL